MANQYSDFYTSQTQPQTSVEASYRSPQALAGGVLRVGIYRMVFDLAPDDFGIGDVMRICTLPSGARIGQIYVTSDGASTALTADLGLYKAARHGGAVIDADLFASALALNSGVTRTDELLEAATLAAADRWKPLWAMADLGAGTYTTDPMEDWDLAWTATAAVATADETTVVEVQYILPHGD